MNNTLIRTVIAATLVLPTTLMSASASLADMRDFSFNNRTGGVINQLYVSSSNRENWGRNLLRGGVIRPGRSVDVAINEGDDCMHDLRAQFQDGTVVEVQALNLCEIKEYSFYP
jgi:hypothetical protein